MTFEDSALPLKTPPHVLLTRSEPQSQMVKPDYENLGLTVCINPVFKVIHLPADPNISSKDTIIITSQNAVHSLDFAHPKVNPIVCVGEKTKSVLEEKGFTVTTCQTSAHDLLDTLQSKTNPFIFLRGPEVTVDFSNSLQECRSHLSYETQCIDSITQKALTLLNSDHLVVCPIYSRKSFEKVHKLLSKYGVDLKKVILLGISSSVFDTSEGDAYRHKLSSVAPTHDGMLAVLKTYLNQRV